MPRAAGLRGEPRGLVERVAYWVAGKADGALGTILILATVFIVISVVLVWSLPAPDDLGRAYFSLACAACGTLAGVGVGAIFTPTSRAEARRFSSLQSFVLGLGGAALFALLKKPLTANS